MKQHAFILLLLLHASILVQGQQAGTENIPQVGKPLPPFVLHNVEYFEKSTVTNDDFKGRWLFLEFWYRGCVGCLISLNKISDLQGQLPNDINFLVVGVNDDMHFGKGVRPLYERLREKGNFKMAAAYDSLLRARWGFHSFPYVIIADPAGIVRVITDGHDLTVEKIRRLLKGEAVQFSQEGIEKPAFDPESSHTRINLRYRSQLSQWQGEHQQSAEILEVNHGLRVSRISMRALYNLAYTGKTLWIHTDSLYSRVYPQPVWEVQDEALHAFDYDTGHGIYNYDLVLPAPKTRLEVMNILQQELANAFGFEASVEERNMPVWKLVATKGAGKKLRTKGAPAGFTVDITGDGGAGGFGFRNYPIAALYDAVVRFMPQPGYPCFDETGITHNIDIDMNVNMMDQEAVKKELQKIGLDLILSTKKMKVVVIREKERRMNN